MEQEIILDLMIKYYNGIVSYEDLLTQYPEILSELEILLQPDIEGSSHPENSLIYAISMGYDDIVDYLLKTKFDINEVLEKISHIDYHPTPDEDILDHVDAYLYLT